MVEEPDVDESERFLDALGDELVRLTRLGHARRVIVGDDDRSGVVEKGLDARVEMYSAFYDPLVAPRCSDSGLAGVLRADGVTDVYVVGLAADYCVRFTAVDAAAEGFRTVIIEEGTRAVDEAGWAQVREEIEEKGVKVVSMDGEEVRRVVELGKKE